MRIPRKLAPLIGAPLACLLGALILVPILFQDRISTRIGAEINEAVDARVAWKGASLGVLRDFPNATLSLDGLSIVGVKSFAGDTLVSIRQARLVLDIGSVIRHVSGGGRIVIRDVVLQQPRVKARVLADGRANWDISRQQNRTGTASRAVGVTLKNLRIVDGAVVLDDRHSHLEASIMGLEESLRGDFSRDRFVLATRTRADSVSLRFGGVPYLTRVAVELNADVDADLKARRFTFTNDSLRLNKLVLAFAGSVSTATPDVAVDLTFATPNSAFRDMLSLVPAIYGKDFDRIQTAGFMSTTGRVRGQYGVHAFPAFAIRARVDRGAFRYPSLPLPARDISMELAIDNPGGDVDRTVVDLKSFHAVIGGRPLDARMVMRTPVSDPDVDFSLRGALSLADVGRTMKLEGVRELSGVISADVAMHARMSDMDAGRYDRIAARGGVAVAGLELRSTALPHAITVDNAALRLTPRTLELTSMVARVGSSDVRATGSLDNVLGWALRDQELRGTATVSSANFDLNEWRSKDKTTEVIPVPPRVDFAMKASAARVTYGAITAANVHGNLHVKDQRVTLSELQMDMLRGSVVANGFYDTSAPGRPLFDFDLRLAAVDIPSAFTALKSVQTFAPIARWAQGSVSGTVGLKGPLGKDMVPVFTALTGKGALATERLVVQGAPVLEKLADAVSIEQLRKPALGAIKASFDVADGRVHVKPFVAKVNGIDMTVAGSNGVDQSIAYDLGLSVPRSALGSAGSAAVARLASQAGQAGAALSEGATVKLAALVTGTMMNPSVRANFASLANSARDAAQNVVQAGIATGTAAVTQKVDSAKEEARRRASAEADRLVAEAERQASSIRAEARTLAESTKRAGNERADSLLAQATNPAARMAAQIATDRLRQQSDAQAERIVREADARADGIVAEAKRRAEALKK